MKDDGSLFIRTFRPSEPLAGSPILAAAASTILLMAFAPAALAASSVIMHPMLWRGC